MSYETRLNQNNEKIENLITIAETLPDAGGGGIDTSDATATAADIMAGKTAYVNGELVTGEFSLDSELEAQGQLIANIQTALDELESSGGGGGVSLETCTVSITGAYPNNNLEYITLDEDNKLTPMVTTYAESPSIIAVCNTLVKFKGFFMSRQTSHGTFAQRGQYAVLNLDGVSANTAVTVRLIEMGT